MIKADRVRSFSSDGDDVIFNPYNDKNNEITPDEVKSLLSRYGVPDGIFNIELYKRAFVHKSYTRKPEYENEENGIRLAQRPDNCLPLKTKCNERLEFLGDGVLECITKYYLYRRFPKENEGFMTEKKISLVKNEHIGKLAFDMGLHKWFIISKHSEEKNTRLNIKKLGCLFEAFIGALFLDKNKQIIHDEEHWFDNLFVTGPGFQVAQKFIENVFEKHVDWNKIIHEDTNYKNILQVKIQKHFKCTPIYMIIKEDDEFGYTMGVFLSINTPPERVNPNCAIFFDVLDIDTITKHIKKHNSILVKLGESTHKIKKKAEQDACLNALDILL